MKSVALTLVLILFIGMVFLLIWPLKLCADGLASNNIHP